MNQQGVLKWIDQSASDELPVDSGCFFATSLLPVRVSETLCYLKELPLHKSEYRAFRAALWLK